MFQKSDFEGRFSIMNSENNLLTFTHFFLGVHNTKPPEGKDNSAAGSSSEKLSDCGGLIGPNMVGM